MTSNGYTIIKTYFMIKLMILIWIHNVGLFIYMTLVKLDMTSLRKHKMHTNTLISPSSKNIARQFFVGRNDIKNYIRTLLYVCL
jgi:hypothetical protein